MAPLALDHDAPGPGFLILNTEEFDRWFSAFAQGITALEDQKAYITNGRPYSQSRVSQTTQALLDIAKALATFLLEASNMSTPSFSAGFSKAQRHESAWIATATVDLQVNCHRYSLAVLDITNAIEKQAVRDPLRPIIKRRWDRSRELESNVEISRAALDLRLTSYSSATPATSGSTSTSFESLWSDIQLASPTDSTCTYISDGPRRVWEELGDASVYGDTTTAAWSPSSDASSEYHSHW